MNVFICKFKRLFLKLLLPLYCCFVLTIGHSDYREEKKVQSRKESSVWRYRKQLVSKHRNYEIEMKIAALTLINFKIQNQLIFGFVVFFFSKLNQILDEFLVSIC